MGARPVAARPSVGGGESRASSRVPLSAVLIPAALHAAHLLSANAQALPAFRLLSSSEVASTSFGLVSRRFLFAPSIDWLARGSVCCSDSRGTFDVSVPVRAVTPAGRRRPPRAVTVKSFRADVQ